MDITDITRNFGSVNWYGVMGATVAAFVLGGMWFAPFLFGRFRPRDVRSAAAAETHANLKMEWIFVAALIMLWLAASVMAALLGPNADAVYGLQVGLLIGLFLVTPAVGVTYIFERRPVRFWLVNAGYHTVAFGLMGLIIGATTG